jgi:hypothetical protein
MESFGGTPLIFLALNSKKMKKLFLGCCLLVGFFLAGYFADVVSTRPADIIYVGPVSPAPGWIWISAKYERKGGGYWHPAKPGRTWKKEKPSHLCMMAFSVKSD